MAAAPLAVAEEFSNTTKHETLTQAIQFEKYKIAATEAQAKKDAAEAAAKSGPARSQTAKASRSAQGWAGGYCFEEVNHRGATQGGSSPGIRRCPGMFLVSRACQGLR